MRRFPVFFAIPFVIGCSSGETGEDASITLDGVSVLDFSYAEGNETETIAANDATDVAQPFDLVLYDDGVQPVDPGVEVTYDIENIQPDITELYEVIVKEVTPCLNEPTVNGFRDNCDGTVNDTKTGRLWQKGMFEVVNFIDGKAYCNNLILADMGGWRLPSIDELRSLIIDCPATQPSGACKVHDSCQGVPYESCRNKFPEADPCDGCALGQGSGPQGCYYDPSFEQGCFVFISSTQPKAEGTGDYRPWHVNFLYGSVDRAYETSKSGGWVRCVH